MKKKNLTHDKAKLIIKAIKKFFEEYEKERSAYEKRNAKSNKWLRKSNNKW